VNTLIVYIIVHRRIGKFASWTTIDSGVASMQKIKFFRFLPLLLAFVCVQISAQNNGSAAEEADEPVFPADEFDRGTPFRSAEGFLAAVDAGDYETAAEYLDLRNLRGAASVLTGAQLARRLYVVVKRASWADVGDLVDDPAGRKNDSLPVYRDSIGVVLLEGKEIRLFMQKVPRGDGVSIWKVSNATVSRIPELYGIFGYPEVIENLRRNLPDVIFLGYELFKYVILLAVGILVYGMVLLIALAIRRTFDNHDHSSNRRIFRFLALPVGIWAVIMSLNGVAIWLGQTATAEAIQRVTPVPILITVWVMFAGMNLIRDIYASRLDNQGRPGALVLLRPVGTALKLLVTISAVLIYLDNLGVNITTVLAGLGVGGIAIALALQRPMEDVLGAVTLYTEQPIRVGDFCRIGTETGTIEEIGLRTTRIRTLANTVIAIPNGRLATEAIDNFSARKMILYRPVLRLRYDASPAQLQQILESIRELFTSHERVLHDNHRVRFTEIADDALLVEAYAYLDTTNWPEYLELAEDLNMRILEIVAGAGTTLSLPTRALHVEQSVPGLDTNSA
jgi:MscS family membrane protein